MTRDHRDDTIAQLADDLALAVDRATNAEASAESYRLLSQQLLHALHHVTLERDVLREQRRLDRHRDRTEPRRAA